MDMTLGDEVSLYESNRRLLVLAEKLISLPDERFKFSSWVGDDWKGKYDLSCGTTACSLGWATTVREFRKRGLRMATPSFYESAHPQLVTETAIYSGSAGERLFGLTGEEGYFLFRWKVDSHVTREDAIKRIFTLVEKRQLCGRRLNDYEVWRLKGRVS